MGQGRVGNRSQADRCCMVVFFRGLLGDLELKCNMFILSPHKITSNNRLASQVCTETTLRALLQEGHKLDVNFAFSKTVTDSIPNSPLK